MGNDRRLVREEVARTKNQPPTTTITTPTNQPTNNTITPQAKHEPPKLYLTPFPTRPPLHHPGFGAAAEREQGRDGGGEVPGASEGVEGAGWALHVLRHQHPGHQLLQPYHTVCQV